MATKIKEKESETFIFEVFGEKGQRLMWTNSPEAVYSEDILKNMIKSGLKLKMNGKVYKPK